MGPGHLPRPVRFPAATRRRSSAHGGRTAGRSTTPRPDPMKRVWDAIKDGYLRVISPVADLMVRHRVSPNAITTFGTLCTNVAGVIYATGHIRTAGLVFG